MKKKLLTIIAILLVTVMAGCAAIAADNSAQGNSRAQSGAVTKDTVSAQQTTKTSEQVKKIAFDHAKVKEADVKDLEVELDKDDGTLHFDVSFDAGDYDYKYEIDAYSGKILHSEKERDDDNVKKTSTTTTTTTKTKKTVAQVKKIALDHAKVRESAVRDLEIELDKEGSKVYYEVTFESGGYDYEYEIDAYSGKILHSEKEKDD